MSAPKGWGATEDISEPCDECGCYGGHNPTCSHEVAPILYVGADYWEGREAISHPERYAERRKWSR